MPAGTGCPPAGAGLAQSVGTAMPARHKCTTYGTCTSTPSELTSVPRYFLNGSYAAAHQRQAAGSTLMSRREASPPPPPPPPPSSSSSSSSSSHTPTHLRRTLLQRKKFFCDVCLKKKGMYGYKCVGDGDKQPGCDFDICAGCMRRLVAEQGQGQGQGQQPPGAEKLGPSAAADKSA
eukprot:gene6251-1116_t